MAKRFASHTNEEIFKKRANLVPVNTSKANRKAGNTLRSYLIEKQQETCFESFEIRRIAEILCHFYLDARRDNGELYKTSSLQNFRYGLNRYLNTPPLVRNVDIIKDPEFYEANQCFRTALSELKAAGKGDVTHYPSISNEDFTALCTNVYMNPSTPTGLFNKVHFDIRIYFCRRGNENISDMRRDTFSLGHDATTGLKYVKKTRDELTKNRRENEPEGYTGIMPEHKNSPFCPVRSFEKYVSKLNPGLDRLWQRPKDSFVETDESWYCNRPVGKDTLSCFMSKFSNMCKLSKIYTNHSIRTTGVTILSKKGFSSSQIMSLTGHKSANSLAIYHRVSDEEKVQMGQAITSAIHENTSMQLAPQQPPACPLAAIGNVSMTEQNSSTIMSPSQAQGEETVTSFDFNQLFDEVDFGEHEGSLQLTTYQSSTTVLQGRNAPMFSGCKIGTINITIQQK